MSWKIHPLVALSAMVVLSLVVAGVLFGILDSTGLVQSKYAQFGGAAAGFFACLFLLHRWYGPMERGFTETLAQAEKIQTLEETLHKFTDLPPFEVPPSFAPYIDHEHSMLFCFPKEWRRQPLQLQLQSVYTEDPFRLRAGDEFPGQFSVAISSPGQQTYSVKEMVLMAKQMNIPPEKLSEELGVEISEKTESLQVPLERVLHLLGAEGQTRQEQIYEMNFQVLELLPGENIRRETEVVNGIQSLLVERKVPRSSGEPLVQFYVITYVGEGDLIFTFVFVDNISDRDRMDVTHKLVMSTVKFWRPFSAVKQQASAATA